MAKKKRKRTQKKRRLKKSRTRIKAGKKTMKKKTMKKKGKRSKSGKVRKKEKRKGRIKNIRKRIRIKIKKPYPRKYLRNVSPENSLWIINGNIVKSLRELLKELKMMNDEAFRYHTNKERNDFSKWVREIIGDRILAADLKKVKVRDKAIRVITSRIKQQLFFKIHILSGW